MKRIALISIFILASFAYSTAKAQNVKPYLFWGWFDEDNAIGLDTTTLVAHVKLKSCDTDLDTTGTGILYYWYQTTKTIANYGLSYFKLLVPNYGMDTIYPTGIVDYIPFVCDSNDLYLRQNETGPTNVIIIWPAFLNPSTPLCDSGMYIFTDILIDNPWIGIEEEGIYKFGSTVFPNPAPGNENVFVKLNYSKPLEQAIIYNSLGQIVANKNQTASGLYELPTSELPKGVYNIHLIYSDKKSEVVKFIKN